MRSNRRMLLASVTFDCDRAGNLIVIAQGQDHYVLDGGQKRKLGAGNPYNFPRKVIFVYQQVLDALPNGPAW